MKIFLSVFLLMCYMNGVYGQVDHWETVIYAENSWQYQLGNASIPDDWNMLEFDDSNWESGIGGIGYGDGDDNTVILATASLFMRRNFDIVETDQIVQSVLHADYDDSFVAYINGVEVARANILGENPAYNQWPDFEHEANVYQGGLPDTFLLDENAISDLLEEGDNVLAIQVHNAFGPNSSDMTAAFYLSLGINDATNNYGPTPSWFDETFFSSNLPIVKINSFGEYIPDEPAIDGEMGIIWNGDNIPNSVLDEPNEFFGPISIERRGQSSLDLFPKNSFKIESKDEAGEDTDVSFLNFPEEEDWILYGPYSDKSLMRNVLSMHIARSMGQYASRTRFVELLINGDYQGIYVFMEKIKRDESRVDIADLNEDDIEGDELTGGYVFKIDKGEPDWYSQYNMVANPFDKLHFQYVSPNRDKIQFEQEEYIQAYVDSFENAIYNTDGIYGGKHYSDYIELNSFVDNFIINELSKNVDGYRLSSYFHKKKDSNGGKIYAGPIWDYNIAYGNGDYCEALFTNDWMYEIHCDQGNPFWWAFLMMEEDFTNPLKCRWDSLRQGPLHEDSLYSFIDQNAQLLAEAQARNFDKWPILGEYVWPNGMVYNTYGQEIQALKSFITNRLNWMDANMLGECNPAEEPPIAVSQNPIQSITISPNPAQNYLNIRFQKRKEEAITICLKNMLGECVQSIQLPKDQYAIQLDIAQLPTAIYSLQLSSNNQLIHQSKVVIIK